jgi:hypothetical protein
VHPYSAWMQEPSLAFDEAMKLLAVESVQPNLSNTHAKFTVAEESKFTVPVGTMQPYISYTHSDGVRSTFAMYRKFLDNESVQPSTGY